MVIIFQKKTFLARISMENCVYKALGFLEFQMHHSEIL